ncbi:hypothetical protein GCM10009414_05050 [Tatumella terrea]
MQWRINNDTGGHYKPYHRLMGHKSAATIDILALAVTFLRIVSHLKTATGMCCVSTLRAIHHF